MKRVFRFFSKSRRNIMLLVIVAIIVLGGTMLYQSDIFRNMRYQSKIPENIRNILSVIEENADKHIADSKKVIPASTLIPYIQEYEGGISLPYKKDVYDEAVDFDVPSMIMRNMDRDI